jgi:hypothetical protein
LNGVHAAYCNALSAKPQLRFSLQDAPIPPLKGWVCGAKISINVSEN